MVFFLLLLLGAWANIKVNKNQFEYVKPRAGSSLYIQYQAQDVKGYEGSSLPFQPREYVRIGTRSAPKHD